MTPLSYLVQKHSKFYGNKLEHPGRWAKTHLSTSYTTKELNRDINEKLRHVKHQQFL